MNIQNLSKKEEQVSLVVFFFLFFFEAQVLVAIRVSIFVRGVRFLSTLNFDMEQNGKASGSEETIRIEVVPHRSDQHRSTWSVIQAK
jgi:hypothetical protein